MWSLVREMVYYQLMHVIFEQKRIDSLKCHGGPLERVWGELKKLEILEILEILVILVHVSYDAENKRKSE